MKIRDVVSFAAGLATDKVVPRAIRTFLSQGTEIVTGQVKRLIENPPQADLMRAIMMLEPDDAESLRYHLKKAKEEGREKEMAMAISAALPRKEDGSLNTEEAKNAITQLARMNPDVLDQMFEALSHASLVQHLEHELKHLGEFFEEILVKAAFAGGVAVRSIEAIDQVAEQKAEELNQTRFGRLASRLFR